MANFWRIMPGKVYILVTATLMFLTINTLGFYLGFINFNFLAENELILEDKCKKEMSHQHLTYVNKQQNVAGSSSEMNKSSSTNMDENSESQLEKTYFSLITQIDVTCTDWYRAGYQKDGGWNVCNEEPFKPKAPCLVYSFGIANDFSFDDAMAGTHNCTVRSFDPSTPQHKPHRPSGVEFYPIGLDEHNGQKGKWEMKTLSKILEDFQESNRTLDVLKIDIEHSEWGAFRTMLKENTLAQVKQLVFETHIRNWGYKEELIARYKQYIDVLKDIRNQGFRSWSTHLNPTCHFDSKFTDKYQSRCNELSLVNINFSKS